MAKAYANIVYTTLDEHFSKGDSYIPAILLFSLLDTYKDKGYTDFKDYNFPDLLAKYEKFSLNDKEHRKLVSKHIRCAYAIEEALTKYKYFKGRK